MDMVWQDQDFAFACSDNIPVASEDAEMHRSCLYQIFKRLLNYGLIIHFSKCQFGCEVIDLLGHPITHSGIMPLLDKVEDITQYTQPTSVKGLKSFCEWWMFTTGLFQVLHVTFLKH